MLPRAEAMELELKQFVNLTHGPNSWNEIIALQAQIRKDRKAQIYAQQEKQREVLNAVGIILGVAILAGFIWFFGSIAIGMFGHPRSWF